MASFKDKGVDENMDPMVDHPEIMTNLIRGPLNPMFTSGMKMVESILGVITPLGRDSKMRELDFFIERRISAFHFDRNDKKFSVSFYSDFDGCPLLLEAAGVRELLLTEMNFESISDVAELYGPSDLDSNEFMGIIHQLMCPTMPIDQFLLSDIKNKIFSEIHSGHLKLICIRAVIGSVILCLAKNFQLTAGKEVTKL